MRIVHLESLPKHTPFKAGDKIRVLVSDADFVLVYWKSGAVSEYCAYEPLVLEHWNNYKQFVNDHRYHAAASEFPLAKTFMVEVRKYLTSEPVPV